MNARTESALPPKIGMRSLIPTWEYRHLRGSGVTRLAGGGVAATAAAVCLSYRAYGWAAMFLVLGALNLGGGWWYLTLARTAHSPKVSSSAA